MNRLGVEFPFMVGPMVGLSHVAFRELIRSYLPQKIRALLFTEMLSTRRLPSERLDEVHALRCAENESFFIPQLLGNEERFIAPSIDKLLAKSPWGFDINMGCPASHLLKHNWGVMLMGDKNYAAEVVRIARRHSRLPLSVKLRSGLKSAGPDYLLDFTDSLEKAGADWITLHCRSQEQGHTGEANWPLVGIIAKARSIPVVANGDIQTADDALHVVNEYGVDGAMIGRAATARPWMLGQIAHRLGLREDSDVMPPMTPEEESREYFRACLRFLDLLAQYGDDEPYLIKKFQFFVIQGSRWFHFGHHFWSTTTKAKTLAHLRDLVETYATKNEFPICQRVKFS
jgi:tRNA-dihydrouridine synthase B